MKMSPKQIRDYRFFIDGIGYSICMFGFAYSRIRTELDQIEEKLEKKEKYNDHVFSVILDTWSLIESSYKIRELIIQVKGLPGKSPFVQVFIRNSQEIDELRNCIQHLRTEIPKIEEKRNPLWGAISWVSSRNSLSSYTIIPGDLNTRINTHSISFDTKNLEFTSKLEILAFGRLLRLDKLKDSIDRFSEGFKEWILSKENHRISEENIPIYSFKIELPNTNKALGENSEPLRDSESSS